MDSDLSSLSEPEAIFSTHQAFNSASVVFRSCRAVGSLEYEVKLSHYYYCYYYYEQGALRGIFSKDSEAMHISNETILHLNPVDHPAPVLSNNANIKSSTPPPIYPIDVHQ